MNSEVSCLIILLSDTRLTVVQVTLAAWLQYFEALQVLNTLTNICHWLPVKSLHMILCTNKHLRGEILPHADTILVAHQQILTHEPHLLPAGPFNLHKNHGREEINWWDVEWANKEESEDLRYCETVRKVSD
jgi:hypothetical protein